MHEPLLVELFTEELPPKALKRLGDAFAEGIATRLKNAGLCSADANVEMFATPRRLAVKIANVYAIAP
jgi:glycyl-tRNA synthetase beta chain